MNELEQFINQFSYLRHLNLQIVGSMNLCDGYRWEKLTQNLRTFNFSVELSIDHFLIPTVLESFRSSFWIEEKHWFIAYYNDRLFSIPHFIPNPLNIVDRFDLYTTAPNWSFISKHITAVTMRSHLFTPNCYFANVDTLDMRCFALPKLIASVLNPYRIKHLGLIYIDQLAEFLPLELIFPQLFELSIHQSVTINMIEQIRTSRFRQIRRLKLSVTDEYRDYTLEELFRLFPTVQEFFYDLPIASEQSMFRCIDGFEHLKRASFCVNPPLANMMSDFHQNINLKSQYSLMLSKINLICRVYKPREVTGIHKIYWWIGEQVDHCLKMLFRNFFYLVEIQSSDDTLAVKEKILSRTTEILVFYF